MAYSKQVQQTATQLQSCVTQTAVLNQIENTIALPMQVWGTVRGDMWVQSLSNVGSLFSGNSGSILTRLNSLNGLSSYGSMVSSMPTSMSNQFSMWRETVGNNLRRRARCSVSNGPKTSTPTC